MRQILALDQSTSATKAILFDASGKILDKAARDHRQIYPRPGWVEHDPEEIWNNVLEVIGEIGSRQSLADLVGLSITNQRETVLAFDRHTGRPLHNAIVWQCHRGHALCLRLREGGYEGLVRAKTGLKLDSYFSASKLAWLIENQPELAAKLAAGTAAATTIDSYLIHRLTNGEVFATDHTNASRTLLFDVGRLRWDEELCALFAVPMRGLPEVRESSATFGETDASGLLPRRVPIVGVMGDSQASLFGQRCHSPGATKATFGTGTSVLMNIGHEFKLCPAAGVTALAWVWRGQPTYAFEGIVTFSAATIAWLKTQLGLIHDEAEVEPLALAVPDSGGVYLVPAFSGLSAPYWSADARAAIIGMTTFTRREHVVRAALESIAYQLRDVVDVMRVGAGVDLQRIEADGGATRNAFLMQFTADITGVTLSVSDSAGSSAWGAALSGLLGLGVYSSHQDLAGAPGPTRQFSPVMPPTEVASLHDGWLAAVRRVL